jgi:hypothetical protein
VRGARPRSHSMNAGTAVISSSAVTSTPAAWSSPRVAASGRDHSVAAATSANSATSRMQTMSVAVRRRHFRRNASTDVASATGASSIG